MYVRYLAEDSSLSIATMMKNYLLVLLLLISTILSSICHVAAAAVSSGVLLTPAGSQDTPINVIPTNYTDADGTLLQGFLSLPANANANNEENNNNNKLPAVIVLHDSDGPNAYEQQRASILATGEIGCVGFAADLFGYDAELPPPGENTWGSDNETPVSLLNSNITLFVMRIQAAIDYVQGLDYVDETRVALLGYCLGGTGIVHYLNNVNGSGGKEGQIPVAGVNAVHPSILGDWGKPIGQIDIPALFLTGGDDFLTGPDAMKKLEYDMSNSVQPWETVRYSKIGHAFSNWYSQQNYNERVDARSWRYTVNFLEEVFGLWNNLQHRLPSLPAEVDITPVLYYVDDGNNEYSGYVVMPPNAEEGTLMPVIIMLANDVMVDTRNDDNDTSVLFGLGLFGWSASNGYIGFVAESQARVTLSPNNNTSTTEVFLSRVKAAVNYAKTIQGADPTKIAIYGCGVGGMSQSGRVTCSGYSGAGALYYAMSDDVDTSVKAIIVYNGKLGEVATSEMVADALLMSDAGDASGGWGGGWGGGEVGGDNSEWPQEEGVPSSPSWGNTRHLSESATNKPQILIVSSVDKDDMDDVIKVEKALISLDLNYELTRVSTEGELSATMLIRDQARTLLAEVFAPYEYQQSTSSESITDTNTDNSSAASILATSFIVFVLAMVVGGGQL